jgi:hypothetical protein
VNEVLKIAKFGEKFGDSIGAVLGPGKNQDGTFPRIQFVQQDIILA